MNLPFILDIIIGLIFVYLTMSLLASELQELIATLFQWRAEHLKKSVEVLLSGDTDNQEQKAIDLANKLYSNPLITNINQEAKGTLVRLPRQITWGIGSLYRSIVGSRTGSQRIESVFGGKKTTGPSYIPSETFASTLLDTVHFSVVRQKLSELKLIDFKDNRLLKEIQTILENLEKNVSNNEHQFLDELKKDFDKLQRDFDKICGDFKSEKATLLTTIERLAEKLNIYLVNSESHFPKDEQYSSVRTSFFNQANSLKQDIFGSTPTSEKREKQVLKQELRPSLVETIQTYKQIKQAKNEDSPNHQKFRDIYQEIGDEIEALPDSVIDSLHLLAKRATVKIRHTEEDLNQLRLEVQHWFDSSMDRASGVYKRNAKGIAILIGILLAWAANADSFHIIARLAKNPSLRTVITQRAGAATASSNIKDLRDVNEALDGVPVPIGRSQNNLNQQEEEAEEWKINMGRGDKWSFSWLAKPLGWVMTGIAISMGAPFWFDLLGKVVNVRNVGGKPSESSGNISDASQEEKSEDRSAPSSP